MSKGVITKENILKKSAELFNVYGYHGCTLSDIMSATNLKKGGIYNHFKNKDEIALGAFDHSFQKVIRRFRERLDQDTSSLDKLNSIIEVFGSFAEDPVVKGGCPVFNTAVDSTNTHPLLTKKARESINTLKTYIEIKVKEGIAAGEFIENVNSNEVSTLIITTLEGAIIMSRVNGNTECVDIAMKHLKQHIALFSIKKESKEI